MHNTNTDAGPRATATRDDETREHTHDTSAFDAVPHDISGLTGGSHAVASDDVPARAARDEAAGGGGCEGRVLASFVVPCFREQDTVARTIEQLDAMARRRTDCDFEIIIVDDGSDDDTSAVALSAAEQSSTPVRILRHRENAGLGAGLRTGFGASSGDVVIAVDCDLSYSISDIERLLDKWLESHPHIVIASPYMQGGHTADVPHALEVRSRQANRFLNACAYHDVKTITGMVRAYDGPFVRSLALKAEGADIMVEIIYKAQILRARIEEIPATLSWTGLQTRAARSTLTSTRSRMMTYRSIIQGYLWRPFWVPIAPGLAFGLIALVLICTGQLGWHGLAVGCLVLAPMLVIIGMISLQAKRYFEELYNLGYGLKRVSAVEPFRAPTVAMTPRAYSKDVHRVTIEEVQPVRALAE